MDKICRTCLYYLKYTKLNNGLCIRYPNEVAKNETDTCGEWKENKHYVPQLLTEG